MSRTFGLQQSVKALALAPCLLALTVLTSNCGRTAFQAGDINQLQKGPGQFTVPPKVDILLAEDDTGSIISAFSSITAQFPAFLNSLDQQGWDYRFAVTPLTTQRNVSQVMTSKYDANWFTNGSGQWKPPIPGADPLTSPAINPALFRLPQNFTSFLTSADVTNQSNQYEPGFLTIKNVLQNSPDFLRPDAVPVVIVIGNGNDSSGVTFCDRGDGLMVPCEYSPTPEQGTSASSFQQYKADFLSISDQFKLYAAVAYTAGTGCLGSTSYVGYRYYDMATELGGASYNVCSTPISAVLSGIAAKLQLEKINYRTRYLVLGIEPDLDTLKITKYPDGNLKNGEVIPANDPVNGWTYQGGPQTVATVDFPAPLFEGTGYVIELHGAAKLWGDDSARIEYKPEGTSNSSN